MKKIRQNVFETNSSSTHSISIADDSKQFIMDTILPDQDGKVFVNDGEFGWEWAKYNDAHTKLSYAYTDGVSRELLEEVIKEQTGAEQVIFNDNTGYIDHDSVGTANSVCVDVESTRQFIFNKNSWLFTGNDNSTPDPTFYDVPEFQQDRVINPEYTHELKIEGFDNTTKFMHEPTEEELSDAFHSLLQDAHYLNGYFDTDMSAYAQIHRDGRRYFKFDSWRIPIDYKNKRLPFIKECWNEANEIWKRDFEGKDGQDWSNGGYEKCREIEKELLVAKDSPYLCYVSYDIVEL